VKISTIGYLVWRPLLHTSRYCADRLTSLFERVMRADVNPGKIRKSILGKLVTGITFEVGGAYVGGAAGKAILGTAFRELGRNGFPVLICDQLPIAAFVASYSLRAKTNRACLAALGLGIVATGIAFTFSHKDLSEFGAAGGLMLGNWAGYYFGAILGGYGGLKLANSSVVMWDRTNLPKSYAIGMSKQFLAGAVFEAVIKESTLPYLRVPINLGRTGVSGGLKILAFSSNTITALKYLFQERQFSRMALVPLMIKTACERYNQKNSVPITNKLIHHITKPFNIIPSAKKILRSFLRLPICFKPLEETIQSFSNQSDKLAVILMRSLHQYMSLCKHSEIIQNAHQNPAALEIALCSLIPRAPLLSFGLSRFDSHFNSAAKSLLHAIQQGEEELVGHQFTKELGPLSEILSVHLKYFFIYTITHIDTTAISPAEEKEFAIDVSDLIFSLYGNGRFASYTHQTVRWITSTFFECKKRIYPYFEQPPEKAVILIQPEVIGEYNEEFLGPEERAILSCEQMQVYEEYL